MRTLIGAGADAKAKAGNGETAFSVAKRAGRLEIAEFLEVATTVGENELADAAGAGDLPRVQALLASNADVNGRTSLGVMPLMSASLKGFVDVVRSLLDAGADANAKTDDGVTALLLASQEGHADARARAGRRKGGRKR